MVILGLEFLALIVICHIYTFMRPEVRVSESKTKRSSGMFVMVAILLVLVMLMFASWYVSLGLAS
jgi:hypothetical protein